MDILARLREWSILANRAWCHSCRDNLRGFCLIGTAGVGDSCDDLGQSAARVASPGCFPEFRASGTTEFTRRPGTAFASSHRTGDAKTPGVVRAD